VDISTELDAHAKTLVEYAVLTTGDYGMSRLVPRESAQSDHGYENRAIIAAASAAGLYNVNLDTKYPMLDHRPRTDGNPLATTLVAYAQTFFVCVRGDARKVLPLCTHYYERGKLLPMKALKYNGLMITAEQYMRQGYRVLAVATKNSRHNSLVRLSDAQSELIFEGFLCFYEPLLPGCAETLSRAQDAGLRVIMMCSGTDDKNYQLGRAIGLVSSREECIDGAAFDAIDKEALPGEINKYNIYQAMSFSSKRALIAALKKNGETVGYMGTKTSDIVLLDDADAGFSQSVTLKGNIGKGIDLSRPGALSAALGSGGTGSEALRFVADVIVSEVDMSGNGGFNSVYRAIERCENIYRNVGRIFKYLICTQGARLLLLLFGLVFGTELVLPLHMLILGGVIDLAAILSISFEKPEKNTLRHCRRQSGSELARRLQPAVFALLWAALVFFGTKFYPGIVGQSSAYSFLASALLSFVTLGEVKRGDKIFGKNITVNNTEALSFLLVCAFFTLCAFFGSFGSLFGVVGIGLGSLGAAAVSALVYMVASQIYKLLFFHKSKKTVRVKKGTEKNNG